MTVAVGALVAAAVLGYGLLRLHRALPVAPSAFDAALRTRHRAAPVDSLDRAENAVAIAIGSAGDAHWRLRPMVRDIAAAALHGRGVDLDRQPDAARALLGEDAWDLVRPDRPRPADGFAPGVPADTLAGIFGVLEELQR